jgi:hypothetical protein
MKSQWAYKQLVAIFFCRIAHEFAHKFREGRDGVERTIGFAVVYGKLFPSLNVS